MTDALPPCHHRELVSRAFGPRTAIPSGERGHANPGLVFERFLRVWYDTRRGPQLEPEFSRRDRDASSRREGPGKRDVLESFCRAYAATAKEGKGLVAMTHRRLQALLAAGSHQVGSERTYRTRWRVVTGLGADHPLENGFMFDRSSGAPYFPGSSVKGLCRAAAGAVLGLGAREQTELFGTDPDLDGDLAKSPAAGSLVFLPAYPEKDHWPTLEVDVVNNHHPSYYRELERGGSSTAVRARPLAVRETDSPVPVFFLTVAPDTPFTFRICGRDARVSMALVERGFECLEAGLDLLGLGAKTAAGYGTFTRSSGINETPARKQPDS